MKRTPLRAKRDRPRRNEGRVAHQRMKPKTVDPTPEQRRYHFWLRENVARCEACGALFDLVVHHILPSSRRDHWNVVLICAPCHNGRTDSVHLLGSEEKFQRHHGVDLKAIAPRRLQQWGLTKDGAGSMKGGGEQSKDERQLLDPPKQLPAGGAMPDA